jgi:phage gp36-like protein
MSKYNCEAIFGTADVQPSFGGGDVELIKKIVKIIASYYLVRMANPNVNIELFRADYEDALEWLKDLQAGNVNPDLPYKDNENTDSDGSSDVFWNSLPKQNNFF